MAIDIATRKGIMKSASGHCPNCWLHDFSASKQNCLSHSPDSNSKQKRQYSKGETVIRNGEPAKGIFCLQEGAVKVSRKGKQSNEFIPWIAKPGDILGLNAIISEDVFSFSASALNQVTACFVPAPDLQKMLVNEPEAFIKILKNVCESLNSLEDKITSLSSRKKTEVLAEVLIAITSQTKPLVNDGSPIGFSIRDLAGLTGTSKNYLNKILADLSEKDIISVHNRKVIIQNREALLNIAIGNATDD
jgi:CRP-like cAMP-binding protein